MYEKQEKNMCGPIDDHVEDSKYLYILQSSPSRIVQASKVPKLRRITAFLAGKIWYPSIQ